nr:hypothetical protein [Calditrichia bacterium]
DPNHVANNFSHDCLQCHSTDAWDPANFDHSNTNFPLTGAHIPLDCISCHDQGYVNTPSDCFSCHEPDFTSTTDPDHVANNFSHNCLDCHNTNTWDDADFDHSNTGFPLTGAHIPLDCIACHDQGYQNTPSDCFACHQDNFNNTTNPDHQAAGFPTDCEQCHSTSLWDPSTFDHDNQYFPIYSGQHRNEWNLCSDCHIANNYATFECIFCHEHNRNNEDDNHRGVRNYVYESAACYNCHPDGREGIIPKILIDERLDRVR